MRAHRQTEALHRARSARRAADALLADLIRSRDGSERRLAESGRPDPMKQHTGASALDRAIASTVAMIDALDEVLERDGAMPTPTIVPGTRALFEASRRTDLVGAAAS